MSDDLIEAVAKAIYLADYDAVRPENRPKWTEFTDRGRESYRHQARVAIEIVRKFDRR